MNKDEAAAFLSGKGYDAKIIDGVVTVLSGNRSDYDKIGRVLKKAGYRASYGWRKVITENG